MQRSSSKMHWSIFLTVIMTWSLSLEQTDAKCLRLNARNVDIYDYSHDGIRNQRRNLIKREVHHGTGMKDANIITKTLKQTLNKRVFSKEMSKLSYSRPENESYISHDYINNIEKIAVQTVDDHDYVKEFIMLNGQPIGGSTTNREMNIEITTDRLPDARSSVNSNDVERIIRQIVDYRDNGRELIIINGPPISGSTKNSHLNSGSIMNREYNAGSSINIALNNGRKMKKQTYNGITVERHPTAGNTMDRQPEAEIAVNSNDVKTVIQQTVDDRDYGREFIIINEIPFSGSTMHSQPNPGIIINSGTNAGTTINTQPPTKSTINRHPNIRRKMNKQIKNGIAMDRPSTAGNTMNGPSTPGNIMDRPPTAGNTVDQPLLAGNTTDRPPTAVNAMEIPLTAGNTMDRPPEVENKVISNDIEIIIRQAVDDHDNGREFVMIKGQPIFSGSTMKSQPNAERIMNDKPNAGSIINPQPHTESTSNRHPNIRRKTKKQNKNGIATDQPTTSGNTMDRPPTAENTMDTPPTNVNTMNKPPASGNTMDRQPDVESTVASNDIEIIIRQTVDGRDYGREFIMIKGQPISGSTINDQTNAGSILNSKPNAGSTIISQPHTESKIKRHPKIGRKMKKNNNNGMTKDIPLTDGNTMDRQTVAGGIETIIRQTVDDRDYGREFIMIKGQPIPGGTKKKQPNGGITINSKPNAGSTIISQPYIESTINRHPNIRRKANKQSRNEMAMDRPFTAENTMDRQSEAYSAINDNSIETLIRETADDYD